jgi:type II secretory pathway pseudopilin PulG
LRPAAGFTLLELLVVMGVMIVLVGGFALAIAGRGGEGAALANAQSLVSSLVGATRAQAALHQTNARLIVYAQMPTAGDAGKYLRSLQILRQETNARGELIWIAVGEPVNLPAPVCVVPSAPVPANHLRSGVTWNNNVATGPVSTLVAQNSFSYFGRNTGTSFDTSQFFAVPRQSGRILYLEFDQTGAVISPAPSANPVKIALTTAILGGNALPQFNNASGVRGLIVRRSGAVSLVDGSTGF